MTNDEMKTWIDNASYQDLLCKWRFAAVGSRWFQGEIGDYYAKKMKEKRAAVSHDGAVSASKSIGCDKR